MWRIRGLRRRLRRYGRDRRYLAGGAAALGGAALVIVPVVLIRRRGRVFVPTGRARSSGQAARGGTA